MTPLIPQVHPLRRVLLFGILHLMKHMFYLVASTIIVVVGNLLATKFYLYYTTWWADVAMHFLGGAWMVIAASSFAYGMHRRLSISAALAIAVIVGIAWEGFEFWFGLIDLTDRIDSIADLILDVAGGVVAYYALQLGHVREDDDVAGEGAVTTPTIG